MSAARAVLATAMSLARCSALRVVRRSLVPAPRVRLLLRLRFPAMIYLR